MAYLQQYNGPPASYPMHEESWASPVYPKKANGNVQRDYAEAESGRPSYAPQPQGQRVKSNSGVYSSQESENADGRLPALRSAPASIPTDARTHESSRFSSSMSPHMQAPAVSLKEMLRDRRVLLYGGFGVDDERLWDAVVVYKSLPGTHIPKEAVEEDPGCPYLITDLHIMEADSTPTTSDRNGRLRWRLVDSESCPFARVRHAATFVRLFRAERMNGTSALLVFGGATEKLRLLNDVHVFVASKLRWRKLRNLSPELKPAPREGHAMVSVRHGTAYVYGGRYQNARPSEDTWILRLFPEGLQWQPPTQVIGKPPSPRADHSMTLLPKQKVWIFGGRLVLPEPPRDGRLPRIRWDAVPNEDDALYLMEVDHPTGRIAWSQPETTGRFPAPRYGHAAAAIGKRLYMFGGCCLAEDRVVCTNDMFVLDTGARRWDMLMPRNNGQPQAREGHSLTAVGHMLLLYGGWTGKRSLPWFDDLYIYDTTQGTWTYMGRMNGDQPVGRHGHSMSMLAWGLDVEPKYCQASGPGLKTAGAGELSLFEIHAYGKLGQRIESGGEDFSVAIVGESQMDARIDDNLDGTYTVTYIATQIGRKHIEVKYCGAHIRGSPFIIEVEAGAADPSKCVAEILHGANTAGHPVVMFVEARDRFGNKKLAQEMMDTDVSVHAYAPSGVQLQVGFECTDDGRWHFDFVPRQSGSYKVDVSCAGTSVVGYPRAVQIAPGPLDASKCVVHFAAKGTVFPAGHQLLLSVELHDHFGNIRLPPLDASRPDEAEVRVIVEGPSGSTDMVGRATSDGLYEFRKSIEQLGQYSLSVLCGGVLMPGFPKTFTVVAGAPSAARSLVHTLRYSQVAAGVRHVCAVEVRDLYGNLRHAAEPTNSKDAIAVWKGPGSRLMPVRTRVSDRGFHEFEAMLQVAGTYTLEVFCGGSQMPDFPLEYAVVPGPVAADKCVARRKRFSSIGAGTSVDCYVEVRDAFGNLRPAAARDTDCRVLWRDAAGNVLPSVWNATQEGWHRYECSPSTAGSATMEVTCAGAMLAGYPFLFMVDPAATDAGRSTAVVRVASGMAGDVVTVVADVRDAYGNKRVANQSIPPEVQLQIRAPHGGMLDSDVSISHDGNWVFKAIPELTGVHHVEVYCNGTPLPGFPQVFEVTPGPVDMSQCVLHGSLTDQLVTAGSALSFVVEVRDKYGNLRKPAPAPADAITSAMTNPANLAEARVLIESPNLGCVSVFPSPTVDNFLSFTHVLTQCAPYTLSIFCAGALMPGFPRSFSVVPDRPYVESMVVHASTDRTIFAGVLQTCRIDVRDRHGNLRHAANPAYRTDVLVQWRPSHMAPGAVEVPVQWRATDDGSHEYSCTLQVAGTYIHSVSCGNDALIGFPREVHVMPGPPSPPHCSVTLDSTTAALAGRARECFVQVRDEFGNLRGAGVPEYEQDVHARWVAPDGADIASQMRITPDGRYVYQCIPTLAGATLLHVFCGGSLLAGLPASFEVLAGEPDANNCLAELHTGQCAAGLPVAVTVRLRDQFGNECKPRRGDEPAVSVSVYMADSAPLRGQLSINEAGAWQFDFVPSLCGAYIVSASCRGLNLPTFPQSFEITAGPADVATTTLLTSLTAPHVVAGHNLHLVLHVRDRFGNLRPARADGRTDRDISVSLLGTEGAVPVDTSSTPDGFYVFDKQLTRVGSFTLEVACGGVQMSGYPLSFVVLTGPVDPTQCVVRTTVKDTVPAGEVLTCIVAVHDSFGNLRPAQNTPDDVGVSFSDALGRRMEASWSATDEGFHQVQCVAQTAGACSMHARAAGALLTGYPFSFAIIPGDICLEKTVVVATREASVVAGATQSCSVLVYDSFGNPRPASAAEYQQDVAVTWTRAQQSVGQVERSASEIGAHVFQTRLTAAGACMLEVSCGGQSVHDFPFEFSVLPAAASAEHCESTLELGTCAAGLPVYVTLLVRDQFGNERPSVEGATCEVTVGVRSAGGQLLDIDTQVADEGRWEFAAVPEDVGDYHVDVRLGDVPLPSFPRTFRINAGAVDLRRSAVQCNMIAQESIPVGFTLDLVVEVRDKFGNVRIAQIEEPDRQEVRVTLLGPDGPEAVVCTATDECFYHFSFLFERLASYSLTVLCGSACMPAFPHLFEVVIGPPSPSVSVLRTSLTDSPSIWAGTQVDCDVVVHDAYGNLRGAGDPGHDSDVVLVFRDPNGAETYCTQTVSEERHYVFSCAPEIAGTYSLEVLVGGQPLDRTPLPFYVWAGPVDASRCVAHKPAEVLYPAGGRMLLLVEARDQYGNLRHAGGEGSEGDVTVCCKDPGGEEVPFETRFTADGLYEYDFNLIRAGTCVIEVMCDGHMMEPAFPFEISVEAGPIDMDKTTAELQLGPSAAGTPVYIIVDVKDSFGNRRHAREGQEHEATVKIMFEGEATDVDLEIMEGSYEYQILPDRVGDYTVDVSVAGHQVVGYPQTFHIGPGGVDVRRSRVTTDLGDSMPVGTQLKLLVEARDKFTNLRPAPEAISEDQEGEVRVMLTGDDGYIPMQYERTAEGLYSFTRTMDKLATYSVTVYIGSSVPSGFPRPFDVVIGAPSLDETLVTLPLNPGHVGKPAKLTVEVRDSFKNTRPAGEPGHEEDAVVTVTADGSNEVPVAWSCADNGSHEFEFTPQVAGLYQVELKVAGQLMHDFPFTFKAVSV